MVYKTYRDLASARPLQRVDEVPKPRLRACFSEPVPPVRLRVRATTLAWIKPSMNASGPRAAAWQQRFFGPATFFGPALWSGPALWLRMLAVMVLPGLIHLPGSVGMVVAAEQSNGLPATVRVLADLTYLRSGPGDDYYPTERLDAGTAVEVWAVDPSGYVAVRPVAGSYSWLRASDVDAVAAGIGEAPPAEGRSIGVIVTDGAVARVGSQINALRHAAQVSLEAGERVQVIDEVRIAEGRHAGLWVRIEPPAGEFRWARMADLETPPGFVPPAAFATAAQAGPAGQSADNSAAIGEALTAIKDASVAVAQAVNDAGAVSAKTQVPPTGMPLPTGMPSPAGMPPPESRPPAGFASAPNPPPQPLGFIPSARKLFVGWLPMGTGVLDPATPIMPGPVAVGVVSASGDELADIDLALSLAVTGPAEAWNLAPVRERLRQVAARTATDMDRTRVEALDARLSRFEMIQSRHRTLAAAAVPTTDASLQLGGMWSSLSTIGGRPIRPGVLPGGASADGQPTWTPPDMTETSGRLATVVSRRPDAPRWAVVDQSNNVIAFITPQTGVNLAPMVGQDISVRGARGYMPEYKRPYVVASEARIRMAAAPEASPDRATR